MRLISVSNFLSSTYALILINFFILLLFIISLKQF